MSVRPEAPAAHINILLDDSIFQVALTSTTKVADVKQAIFKKKDIKPELQIVSFEGKLLTDDEQTLEGLGVINEDTLMLGQHYDASQNSIRVVVSSGSKSREIRCLAGSSVESFHRLVAEEFKGRSSLDLEYDGVQLERDKSLMECGLEDGAQVRLIEQLKGGSQ